MNYSDLMKSVTSLKSKFVIFENLPGSHPERSQIPMSALQPADLKGWMFSYFDQSNEDVRPVYVRDQSKIPLSQRNDSRAKLRDLIANLDDSDDDEMEDDEIPNSAEEILEMVRKRNAQIRQDMIENEFTGGVDDQIFSNGFELGYNRALKDIEQRAKDTVWKMIEHITNTDFNKEIFKDSDTQ